MSERVPFLNTAYAAYHHRARPSADEELARVGPGTPCGEYLRRFWQPVIRSEELQDLPRRLRIMGRIGIVLEHFCDDRASDQRLQLGL